jgi:hypothetical protein
MSRFEVVGSDLVLHLRWGEKIAGLHGDIRAPLTSVRSVSVPTYPWQALRGWRMAGTGIPRIVALGTRRHGTGYDFAALHTNQPAVQVELATGRFERWLASVGEGVDARAEAERIAAAAGIRVSEGG